MDRNILEAFVYTYFFFKLIISCISGLQDYLELCAHLHCVSPLTLKPVFIQPASGLLYSCSLWFPVTLKPVVTFIHQAYDFLHPLVTFVHQASGFLHPWSLWLPVSLKPDQASGFLHHWSHWLPVSLKLPRFGDFLSEEPALDRTISLILPLKSTNISEVFIIYNGIITVWISYIICLLVPMKGSIDAELSMQIIRKYEVIKHYRIIKN